MTKFVILRGRGVGRGGIWPIAPQERRSGAIEVHHIAHTHVSTFILTRVVKWEWAALHQAGTCYNDHGHYEVTMRKMAAGKFKARCLAVMEEVRATGEPVIVTKRGEPVVKLVPAEPKEGDLFGFMAGEFRITGDIESPVVPISAWEVTKQ
jgi:prevent-host-death family protein